MSGNGTCAGCGGFITAGASHECPPRRGIVTGDPAKAAFRCAVERHDTELAAAHARIAQLEAELAVFRGDAAEVRRDGAPLSAPQLRARVVEQSREVARLRGAIESALRLAATCRRSPHCGPPSPADADLYSALDQSGEQAAAIATPEPEPAAEGPTPDERITRLEDLVISLALDTQGRDRAIELAAGWVVTMRGGIWAPGLGCPTCGEPVAYPGAVYCGAACAR